MRYKCKFELTQVFSNIYFFQNFHQTGSEHKRMTTCITPYKSEKQVCLDQTITPRNHSSNPSRLTKGEDSNEIGKQIKHRQKQYLLLESDDRGLSKTFWAWETCTRSCGLKTTERQLTSSRDYHCFIAQHMTPYPTCQFFFSFLGKTPQRSFIILRPTNPRSRQSY